MPKPHPRRALLLTAIAVLSACGDPSSNVTPVDPLVAVNPALIDGVPVSESPPAQPQNETRLMTEKQP